MTKLSLSEGAEYLDPNNNDRKARIESLVHYCGVRTAKVAIYRRLEEEKTWGLQRVELVSVGPGWNIAEHKMWAQIDAPAEDELYGYSSADYAA